MAVTSTRGPGAIALMKQSAPGHHDHAEPQPDAPATAPQEQSGTAQLRYLLSRGRPDPAMVRSIIDAHPGEHGQMFTLLHSTFGNAYVHDVMAASAAPAALGQSSSDISGLVRGDGMTAKTEGLRPRVMELQRRLNATMDAGLKIDGMFGPLTGRATREFQASIRQQVEEFVSVETAEALYGTAPEGRTAPTPGPGGARGEPDGERFMGAASAAGALANAMTSTGVSLGVAQASVGALRISPAGPALSQAADSALTGAAPARELQDAFVATAAGSEAPRVIGNPLVGLTMRDGMTPGTRDRRSRVEKLQTALNQAGPYGLTIDGKFGGDTASALAQFREEHALTHQDAVDADTADHLMGQEAHAPRQDNADAARMDTAAERFAGAADFVRGGSVEMRMAGAELIRTEGTDAHLVASSDSLAAVGQAFEQFAALRGANVGPVALAARQQLRMMKAVTRRIAQAIAETGHGLRAAAPALEVPEPSRADASLANSGALVADSTPFVEAAGTHIAPIGPTGGGKRG